MSHLSLLLIDEIIHTFDDSDRVTVISPVNIAITKYWGKRDFDLNIPLNDSISMTLDMQSLCTQTSITIYRNHSNQKQANSISLNNAPPKPFNKRIKNVINAISLLNKSILNDVILIHSINNFPTKAGLASSASGYSAITMALCHLYGITDKSIIASIARRGSGSATRSIHGGFVKWFTSENESSARQLFDSTHWSELKVIICVISSKEKEIGSSDAQNISTKTSNLLQHRIQNVAKRNELLEKAICERDFDEFANILMRDSNEFHAICMETFPPIFYLNEASKQVIRMCHSLNSSFGETRVGYTFDAGPNAVIVCRDSLALSRTMNVVQSAFCDELCVEDKLNLWDKDDENVSMNGFEYPKMDRNAIEKVIITRLGKGAQIVHSKILGRKCSSKLVTQMN